MTNLVHKLNHEFLYSRTEFTGLKKRMSLRASHIADRDLTFKTTVFPHIRGTAIERIVNVTGAFHGAIERLDKEAYV